MLPALYIWNYKTGQWTKISTVAVGATDLTQGPYELTDSPQRYVSPLGEVKVRIQGVSDSAMTCYADFLEVKDYYKDRTKLFIQINNVGTLNVELASIWVNNLPTTKDLNQVQSSY